MIIPTLLRHHAPSVARQTLLRAPTRLTLINRASITPRCLLNKPPSTFPSLVSRRWETTTTPAKQGRKSPYLYPELINIYLAPTTQTVLAGVLRLATLVVFGLGTFIYIPAIYLDANAPTWLCPAAVLGSSLPFLAAIASGPMITSVRARLPPAARKSKPDLQRWAANPTSPSAGGSLSNSSTLRIQFIRFAPWLVTRDIRLGDLRRLPPSKLRLANLEHQIPAEEKDRLAYWGSTLGRWLDRYFHRYWVNVAGTKRDRSSVPGVWGKVWEGIPFVGEDGQGMKRRSGGGVVPAGDVRKSVRVSAPPAGMVRPPGSGGGGSEGRRKGGGERKG
ncbi:hypothetical protein D0869_15803 [Hortaea werneckii]|uniref:Uncharacterized protein n=2 Tax=Hortaea werneckii TaxID=91943 RepID=A0A3M6VYF2_HORWE|nr:hypothetical protein KC334_g9377 [Hortaea werneckii]KAI7010043.1 hypothetical protein KC355_g6335 [Hortaea werneckii]KAI7165869.1 hypothetical protein KC324_g12327 [Hortaea werneckii]KAI7578239.1 hypothetical protein KC316_g9956 [Hortaea werneckii]KAI7661694.1 hypothetical protein KC318_g9286 [Hortaea werneckii]